MKSKVVLYQEAAVEPLGVGVTRKVLAYLPEQMVVEVSFEEGAVGAVHAHPHIQSTYVCRGEFAFTVEGEEHRVRQGDTLAFAENAPHGCVCEKAGVLIDVFTPMREDFVKPAAQN